MSEPLTWQPEPQYASVEPQKPEREQQKPGWQANWKFGPPQEPSDEYGKAIPEEAAAGDEEAEAATGEGDAGELGTGEDPTPHTPYPAWRVGGVGGQARGANPCLARHGHRLT